MTVSAHCDIHRRDFFGWLRMCASMCTLMVFNLMFVKLLISAMPNAPNGTAIIPWMMLIVGIVRMAKKMDGIILRIGLNPALTGDSLGTRFPGMLTAMTLRNIAQMVPRTAATCFQNVWRAAVCTVGCFALWV